MGYDELAGSKEMKSLNNAKIKLTGKVRRAKKKVEELQEDLKDARADRDRKDEIPDIREKLSGAKEDLKGLEGELSDATLELQDGLREEYDGVFSIHRKVAVGVGQVYQGVLLANGMSDCEFNLGRLYFLFGTTIRAYCDQTKSVYTSFLEDTAVVNPGAATRLCLTAASDESQAVPAWQTVPANDS